MHPSEIGRHHESLTDKMSRSRLFRAGIAVAGVIAASPAFHMFDDDIPDIPRYIASRPYTPEKISDRLESWSDWAQSHSGHKVAVGDDIPPAEPDGITTEQKAPATTQTPSKNSQPRPQIQSGKRDPLKQPFSSHSIWNMPIGSGARYVPAGMGSETGSGSGWAFMPQLDQEPIILEPSAPATSIMFNGQAWGGGNRCDAEGKELTKAPIPRDYVLPSSGENNSAAILLSDGRTILQTQPLTRCAAGGIATALLTFKEVDLYGDGITGAHGGSGLSAIGGSIRLGELRPGQPGPRHALKINVASDRVLYNCSSMPECFRWPAVTGDDWAPEAYGSSTNSQNTAMKMGSLLALPPTVNIEDLGLTSEPGKQIAWTLQNYGAYVTDTGGPGIALAAETGPQGSVSAQFETDYGSPFQVTSPGSTPWSQDLQRILPHLHVVDNNGPDSIGGGGTPRQPLAAELTKP